MKPHQFTVLTQKLGISLLRVSIGVATGLAEIAREPVPLTPRASKNQTRTNSKPLAVGPLIAHELVKLDHDAGHYAITKKGSDYLTLLRHHNLLPL